MKKINRQFFLQSLVLIMLGVIFYANTLKNQYALDDAIVITENKYTQKGLEGIRDIFIYDSFTGFFGEEKQLVTGGRYRPFSIATMAVEYEIFGLNPGISHAVNLIIYLCTVWLILSFLSKVFSSQHFFSLAFLTALFFLIHPVHSEVVANIKGRDELLAFLFGFMTLTVTWSYLQRPAVSKLILSGILFFAGLLSKENAVVFLVLTPGFLYYFKKEITTKKLFITTIPLMFFFVVFLIIRSRVLGDVAYTSTELMNNPFIEATPTEKAGTILLTLGIYLKLLFFPHPLTYDYYPYHIPLTDVFNPWAIGILLVYLALLAYAVYSLFNRQKAGYGLWFYLIPLAIVANVFFPIGTFMNERFVFFSSFGFCFILGLGFSRISEKSIGRIPVFAILFIIIIASGWKTISRNTVWYDDYTLFTHDVNISKNSAKSNVTAGGSMYEKAVTLDNPEEKRQLLDKSIQHLKQALKIHPAYADALLLLGNAYWERDHRLDSVFHYYDLLVKVSSNHQDVVNNLKAIASQMDNPKLKVAVYRKIIQLSPEDFDSHYKLGNIYGKDLNRLDSARQYLESALGIQPDNVDALLDMGVAWGITGNFEKSLRFLLRAYKLEPDNKQIITNIGVTYQRMGNLSQAQRYFAMIEQVDSELEGNP